jgi:carbon storage regulator
VSNVLIVTRRPGERIMVGEDIIVTVMGIHRGQVRVSVSAPRDIAVDREEIYNRKKMVAKPHEPSE